MTVTKRERQIPLKDPGIKRAIADWKRRQKAKRPEKSEPKMPDEPKYDKT